MQGLSWLISLGSSFHRLCEPVRKDEEVSRPSRTVVFTNSSDIPQTEVGMPLMCSLFLLTERH